MWWNTEQTYLWMKIKGVMKYLKPETYILDYASTRTVDYFEKVSKKWRYSSASNKEYALEVIQDDALFYVLSRRLFQEMFMGLYEFLEEDLESQFIEMYKQKRFMPSTMIEMSQICFKYRKKLQMNQSLWVIFCDTDLINQQYDVTKIEP